MSFIRQNNIDNTFLAKIVFVGDSGVGKTSLLTRQTSDQFNQAHLATIGVDFKVKTYDLGIISVKAQMWDTAGQERFKSIQKPYYRGAKAICICFALNNRQSFENLEKRWITEIEALEIPKDNMILIGCKSDLQIEVPTDQILLFAQKHGVGYYQTSAKQNEGVNDAFRSIAIRCAEKEIAQLKNRPRDDSESKKKNDLGKMAGKKNQITKCC